MSDYFEAVKKFINNSDRSYKDCEDEYSFSKDKDDSYLRISYDQVKFNGYTVPVSKSEAEDLLNLAMVSYVKREEENKQKALKELLGK